ncbi:MAG: alpha/beta hydrolase, partial [Chloroflexi bacterium]|nr:alpha/beta hydrolase [Chloroflexota bacterium]
MNPVERRTRRVDVELVFHEWPGDAPPTLLLHGIGNYGRYWDLFAREIDGRLRLVAPDARGHGSSGRPEDGYAADEFVADALAILGALGVDRALVVGHSMGGSHAMRLAAGHPERVLGLVLVDVGVEPMREGADRARRLTMTRPESFSDRAEAEEYLRRTSPGYADEVYAGRLEHAFREEEGRLVWRSSSPALARILAGRGE